MNEARARIHAMFPLDEEATAELDKRLDDLVAAELRAAAIELGDRIRAGGPQARGLAFARNLLNDRADGVIPTPPRRNIVHRDVADALRKQPGEERLVGEYSSRESANGIASLIRGCRSGTIRAYQPAGTFDARVVVEADGVRVFARYTGGGAA